MSQNAINEASAVNIATDNADAESLMTEYLDLWSSAITKKSTTGRGSSQKYELYGLKRLRELILELAIRGKLVQQDPKEESASVFLKRIAEEKSRLVEEGKVKKHKRLPETSDWVRPFELPVAWTWSRLQEVSLYIQRGKGPKYSDSGNVRVISQKCVQWTGFKADPARYVDNNSLDKYQEERFLQSGDLLWNSTGTGTVGRVCEVNQIEHKSLVADSHVTVIRPIRMLAKFIKAYLSAPVVQQRIDPTHEKSLVSGTTKQVELNTSSVTSLEIPIPPLKEQHRIVAKVDELMALCDQLENQTEQSLDAHATLVETLLVALTRAQSAEDLAENWQRLEENWDILLPDTLAGERAIDRFKRTILQLAIMGRLVEQKRGKMDTNSLLHEITLSKQHLIDQGKLKKQKKLLAISDEEKTIPIPTSWVWVRLQDVIDVRDGTHDSPKSVTGPATYPLVTSKDFKNGQIDFSNAKRISKEDHRLISQRSLVEPDDILFSMIGGNIGNQVIVNTSEKFSVKNVALFKYYDKTLTVPRFLKIFTEDLANSLQGHASGGAQPFVSLGKLRNLPFPLPPVEEQHCIVQKVDELMAICDQLMERLNQASETRCQLAVAIVEQGLSV